MFFKHLPAGRDRPFAFLVVVDDLQAPSDADRHRVPDPAGPLAFLAEGGDAVDDQAGRGDLIEQQVVAIARGAADRLRAAGAEPERRMRLLDRARLDDDIVVAPALALIGEPAGRGPRLADYFHRLVEALGRLLGRDAEAGKFVRAITFADAEIEPPVRQEIEGRGLLGDEDRVVPRQDDDGGAEPDALGPRRQIGEHAHRRRHLAKPGEMVLDQKDARKAEPLGLDDIIDKVVIGRAVAGRPTLRPRPAK